MNILCQEIYSGYRFEIMQQIQYEMRRYGLNNIKLISNTLK